MSLYINNTVKYIVKRNFNLTVEFNASDYKSFMTEERELDINEYKSYSLISPSIFNLCYLHLTRVERLNKNTVIEELSQEVEFNKAEMKTIKRWNYSVKEYKRIIENRKIEEAKNLESNKIDKINKNKNVNEKIDWDIPEYEIIRGDWNSVRV